MLYNIPIKNYRKLRFGKIGVTSRHCTTKKFLGQNVKIEAVLPMGQLWSMSSRTGGQNVKKKDVLPMGGHVAAL